MTSRREFLRAAAAAPLIGAGFASRPVYALGPTEVPRITFYGATRQVSGSCHILETGDGVYLVDCGSFISDVPDPDAANRELPFEAKEIKAVLLTHAHADHTGRLPLLYKKGFRGTVYCTDATRDMTEVGLLQSAQIGADQEEEPLFSEAEAKGLLGLIKVVAYNQKFPVGKMTVRYTDAGHILGSAMAEVWTDGRKILFSGDMGPDTTPILCSPAQHYGADAVLVESTYGPAPRPHISYGDVGLKVAEVIKRGGSILFPSFAMHKTQLLIHLLSKMMLDGTIPNTPIISDSSSSQKFTKIYDAYSEYHDPEAREFAKKRGTLFYLPNYREMRVADSLKTHAGKTPAIYISTSGMITHAAAPRHLYELAKNEKNAVLIPGYQAPKTVGRRLLDGEKEFKITLEEFSNGKLTTEEKNLVVKLEVAKVTGFSSHAVGQQILEWVNKFDRVGPVYVVHGDEANAVGLSEKMKEMKVESEAPKKNQTVVIKGDRVKAGDVPKCEAPKKNQDPNPVDK